MLRRAVIALLLAVGITAGMSVAPVQTSLPLGVTVVPIESVQAGLAQCEWVSAGKFCGWDIASSSGNPIAEFTASIDGYCHEGLADNRISYAYNRGSTTFRAYVNDGCWGSFIDIGPNSTRNLTGLYSNNNIESGVWL